MTEAGVVSLVVFDLDGTLVDSLADLAGAANATLARLAPEATALSLTEVRSFVGDGAGKLVSRSLAARGVAANRQEALSIFMTAYRGRLLAETRLYDGIADVLDAIAPGRTLAVLSNKPGELCRTILDGLGVATRFARVWGGDDAPKKPDPAGLSRLVAELGATRATTLMIGDSPNDVKAGRAAGVRSVGVGYGFDPAGTRAEEPDAWITAPRELVALLARLDAA